MKRTFAVLIALAFPLHALAAFPDVPADHPYAAEIAAMEQIGVMRGNDDGTFSPGRVLNRAELLTIAYRAAGKDVRNVFYDGSFSDVGPTAWFSAVMYTAKRDGIIQGYPDGTARPGNSVNIAEATKIILNALGFEIPQPTQEDRLSVGAFTRASTTAWYVSWVNVAFVHELYPGELTEENRFDPGAFLSREHAAVLLDRALKADRAFPHDRNQAQESEDDLPPPPETEPESYESAPESAEVTVLGATRVEFPSRITGQTGARGAAPFAFDLSDRVTLLAKAANSGGKRISLLLYRLEGEAGFSTEFYEGYEEASSAIIRATVEPGSYQMEVRAQEEGELFTLSAEPSVGDGNDGFIEARILVPGTPRTGLLPAYDYEDWFRFTVSGTTRQTVKLASEDPLRCAIFPGTDVDLPSFSGPKCGKEYNFSPGTYHVSVQRKLDAHRRQGYTIELR